MLTPLAKRLFLAMLASVTSAASGLALGSLCVEQTRAHLKWRAFFDWSMRKDAWGCYDLRAGVEVKDPVDHLAVSLAAADCKEAVEAVRGEGESPGTMNYIIWGKRYPWVDSAHFDLFDLTRRLSECEALPADVRSKARGVVDAVDRFVVDSCASGFYGGFRDGQNGVLIVFPDGDAAFGKRRHWDTYLWYHPRTDRSFRMTCLRVFFRPCGARFPGQTITTGSRPWLLSCRPGRGCFPDKTAMVEPRTGQFEYHPDDQRSLKAAFGKYEWCADGAVRDNGEVENWFELLDYWFDRDDPAGGANAYRW